GVNRADFQGVVGTLFSAAGNPLDRVVHTDQAGQAHGATETGIDTQLGFRQADLGALGHDAEVARQAHFQAAAQGQTIDGGYGGHGQGFKRREEAGGFQVGGDQRLFGQLERLDGCGDVGTDDEHVAATGDNDAG